MIKSIIFLTISIICGIAYGHDTNITYKDISNGLSLGRSVIIFNDYQFGSSTNEYVSGSSTVNGGTTTMSAGLIYTVDLVGDKGFVFKNTSGSTTVNVYGFIGSVSANFKSNLLSFEMSGATNTVWSTDRDLEAMMVGVVCHNGTSNFSCGMTSIKDNK